MSENLISLNSATISADDESELRAGAGSIELPDVKDIPGQEHVHPPHLREFADTTISSADEEGNDLFADDEGQNDFNVSEEEKKLLERTENSTATEEDQGAFNAELDNTDNEGDPLNEAIHLTGQDLDVSAADEEDEEKTENEDEGDEENEIYSLGGDDHD